MKRLLHIIITGILLFVLAGCERVLDLKDPTHDPVAVFDDLWKVIDQRYALFPVKTVDWESTYSEYRAKITGNTTDAELFKVLSDMLETLKDGHVTLIAKSDTATYDNFHTLFPTNFNYQNILINYLKSDYTTIGPVVIKIVNNVGYIYYSSFGNDISEEQADAVFREISQTKGLIIDVRSNTGGKSINTGRIFSRLISEKRLVKYEMRKKGTGHNDFFEPEPYYVMPAGNAYTNPIVVLTNRTCFSACNDFVLYMSGLPNVQLMGDQTGGGGAIPYDYVLVNGWKIQYSATITLSPDKEYVENGIQPDQNILITPIDETNGKDPILEKAFLSLH
jgi:Peptidase family S41/Tricorn protease C1 domain